MHIYIYMYTLLLQLGRCIESFRLMSSTVRGEKRMGTTGCLNSYFHCANVYFPLYIYMYIHIYFFAVNLFSIFFSFFRFHNNIFLLIALEAKNEE